MPSHPGRKYICSWERGIKAGSKLISPSSKTISRGSERAKGGKGNIVQELVGEPGVPVVMEISHKIDNSAPSLSLEILTETLGSQNTGTCKPSGGV